MVDTKMIKLTQAAKILQVDPRTIHRWEREGRIKLSRTDSGRVYVSDVELARVAPPGMFESVKSSDVKCAIYARVSSGGIRKKELDAQKDRCVAYATAKGYQIVESVIEIASGLNDHRPKLTQLLQSTNFDILVVEHKDRLTRFGFEYIKTLLETTGRKIEVINLAEDSDHDLMDDFISVITSFCARIYGHRRSTRKKQQLIEVLSSETTD